MNEPQYRRAFLTDVSKGTLLATIGTALASEFGISSAFAESTPSALNFGDMESLVCFMEETPVSKLQPALTAKLKDGVPLKKLVATSSGQKFLEWEPLPTKRHISHITDPTKLLAELDGNIRQNLQGPAAGIVHRCGMQGIEPEAVFQVLLRHAVSEDGALHAENYYQTTWDDFHRTRSAFRWRQLIALARVTASEYGRPAPGQAEARELLDV